MAQGNYVLVENGLVTSGPASLPRGWREISGFNLMSQADLKTLGWLPHEYIESVYNSSTHYRDGYDIDIQEDKVVYTDIVKAFTGDQLAQNTWNDWSTDMMKSDDWVRGSIHLPRQLEDIITMLVGKYPDILNEEGNEIIKKRYNDKKALRATKPSNPNE